MSPLRQATSGGHAPERAANPTKQSSQHLRPRTAEDIANEQTAEQLALRIWAAIVAQMVLSGMSALMDELIQSHLLDDDDEEADEGWLDDHHKREKRFLDEAILDGLDKFPDFAAINNLPLNSDPDIARDAGQLNVLTKCAIGATDFKGKFSRAQLERMVKRDLETRFKKDPKYSKHVREEVPGLDVKSYGSRGRTSSKGTFAKAADYESGGGLTALLCFASEPGGGNHIFGASTIGKTMDSAIGQSIYGWPHEMADDAFGVSWGGANMARSVGTGSGISSTSVLTRSRPNFTSTGRRSSRCRRLPSPRRRIRKCARS